MKDVIAKLSSYNLFNYLFPGVVFVATSERFIGSKVLTGDIITKLFIYYFVGLCISRVGSLVLEPLMKKMGFVKFVAYSDFIRVSKDDLKLELLSEVNNMYRTLCSLFFLLGILFILKSIQNYFEFSESSLVCFLSFLLFLLFAFSYKKQTNYISKRISSYKK